MTLEEAKKILEKEGFSLEGPGRKSCAVSEAFMKYESPEVCEAMQVVCTAGYMIKMFGSAFNARKERLKKEYEKNTKAPGSGEEKPKEKVRIVYPTTFPKADFYYKHVLNEGNPALAEAAFQFNDALLDEQAKKIEKLDKENERLKDQIAVLDACKKHNDKIDRLQIKRLGKEIARLNKAIYKKNMKIEELRKESSRHLRGKMKVFYENIDLEGKLKDKDAVLADVAEELHLSKIREKNLTELCQKYIKANEELKEKLADKVVDKINAQALKSAESALAYKDSYIEKLKNKKVINNRASMEAIAKYVDAVSKAELDGLVLVSWKNDGKEITSVYQLKNGKRYTLSLVYTGEEFLFYKTDLDKKRHIPTPEISEEELMKIQEKVVASYDIAEEGGDHSGVIVLCGKDFIDAIKKMK